MKKVRLTLAAAACCTLLYSVVEAKVYKWVDNNGVTHYGETIPPEYASKDNVQLDEKGRVVKKNDVLTPEEKRKQEETEAKKRADEQAALDQRRRDKALMNTYNSEAEIDLARDRNLQQVEARRNSVQLQLKTAQENQTRYRTDADALRKAGKPVPPALQHDLEEATAKVSRLTQEQAKVEQETLAIKLRYENDKLRFRELSGGKK